MSADRDLRQLHRALRIASAIVPRAQRAEWQNEWIAELTFLYRADREAAMRCAEGLLRDALEMRRLAVVNWYRALDSRDPQLCLRILVATFALLLTISMAQPAVRLLVFSKWGHGAFACFIALAFFSLPSTMVTSRYSAFEPYGGEAATLAQRAGRWRFLCSKLVLVVLSAYLLAVLVTRPFQPSLGSQADWLLVACGLLFNVIAVNWVLTDQRERCPTCMRLLRNPARMGPPSWSLLGSCATEEMCDRGHGLLHQPEWQTSWFENARWLQLDRTWREFFRP
jgi:hypothetical protein